MTNGRAGGESGAGTGAGGSMSNGYVIEGNVVNVDLSAPGAMLALECFPKRHSAKAFASLAEHKSNRRGGASTRHRRDDATTSRRRSAPRAPRAAPSRRDGSGG